MPKVTSKSKDAISLTGTCVFCNSSSDDEELLGKKLVRKNLTVHYFCMLFASGLCQSGKTEGEGILGFLPRDILKEVNRGKKLRCYYCKEKGATIGCVVRSCRHVFHFGCGRENGVLNQFFGTYSSYCEEHRPRQTVPTSDRLAFHGTAKAVCSICMCAVEARASNETLRAPCCKNAWFHRSCIQRQATCSGVYFFKCPLCNNKDYFQHEMLEFGIYIPDQDAEWELEPNAYQELLERHCRCDLPKCHCPQGREYNRDGSKWEIILCVYCGCQGTHMYCSNLRGAAPSWTCAGCVDVVKTKTRGQAKSPEFSPLHKKHDENWLMEKLNKEKMDAASGGGGGGRRRGRKRKPPSVSSEGEGKDDQAESRHQKSKKKRLSFVTVSDSKANSSASKSAGRRGKRRAKRGRPKIDLQRRKNESDLVMKGLSSATATTSNRNPHSERADMSKSRLERKSRASTDIPLVVTGKAAHLLKSLQIDMTPKYNLSSARPVVVAKRDQKALGSELKRLSICMTPAFDYSSMALGTKSDGGKMGKKSNKSPAAGTPNDVSKKEGHLNVLVKADDSEQTSRKSQCTVAAPAGKDPEIVRSTFPQKNSRRLNKKSLNMEDENANNQDSTDNFLSRRSLSSNSANPEQTSFNKAAMLASEPVELNSKVVRELKGLVIDMTPQYSHPTCGISGIFSMPETGRPSSSLTTSSSDSGIESNDSNNSGSLPCPDIVPVIDLTSELDEENKKDVNFEKRSTSRNDKKSSAVNVESLQPMETTPKKNGAICRKQTSSSSKLLERELKFLNIDMTEEYGNPTAFKSAKKLLQMEEVISPSKKTVSLEFLSRAEDDVIEIITTRGLTEQDFTGSEDGWKSEKLEDSNEVKNLSAEDVGQNIKYTGLKAPLKRSARKEKKGDISVQEVNNLAIDMHPLMGFPRIQEYLLDESSDAEETKTESRRPGTLVKESDEPPRDSSGGLEQRNSIFGLTPRKNLTKNQVESLDNNDLQQLNADFYEGEGNLVERDTGNSDSLRKLNKMLEIDMTPRHKAQRSVAQSEGKVTTRYFTQLLERAKSGKLRKPRIRRSLSYDDLRSQNV